MKITNLIRERRGQALVELALVLPILLMILFGIIEFGRIFNAQLTVTHASREGARYGALGTSDMEIIEQVKGSVASLNQEEVEVTIAPITAWRTRGEEISVQVDYQVPLYTPFVGRIVPNPFPVRGHTTMRIE
ncbi:Flp pilus assembly protein TadG [Desulfitispora alkaliphila]|uniref:TadE/TadG family type IV pilus assembly protein n=1 Tax=Desulfitispora alkaliphila TaxID=622674 RepID=UPI003D22612B